MEALKNTLRNSFAVLRKHPQLLGPMVAMVVIQYALNMFGHWMKWLIRQSMTDGATHSVLTQGGGGSITLGTGMGLGFLLNVFLMLASAALTISTFYITVRMLRRLQGKLADNGAPTPSKELWWLTAVDFGINAVSILLFFPLGALFYKLPGTGFVWAGQVYAILSEIVVWWVLTPNALKVSADEAQAPNKRIATTARVYTVICVIAVDVLSRVLEPIRMRALGAVYDTAFQSQLMVSLVTIGYRVFCNLPLAMMFIGFGLLAQREEENTEQTRYALAEGETLGA